MRSTPVEVPAAVRAKWLAELAEALAHAHALLGLMDGQTGSGALVAELKLRIGAAAREVELLRKGRPPRSETDPRWTNLPPWD